jgi:hypothetical protein
MRTIIGRIERQGPLVYPMVTASHYQVSTLRAQGLTAPPPQQIAALIDTGASATVLDASIIASLGLTLVGQTQIHTPTTGSAYEIRSQYAASVTLMDQSLPPSQGLRTFTIGAVESQLATEGFLALIGWDILSHCILRCDGPRKRYRLKF